MGNRMTAPAVRARKVARGDQPLVMVTAYDAPSARLVDDAGVDLILVSYDPDQYFPIMDALLEADREGRLSQDALARSDERLRRARTFE